MSLIRRLFEELDTHTCNLLVDQISSILKNRKVYFNCIIKLQYSGTLLGAQVKRKVISVTFIPATIPETLDSRVMSRNNVSRKAGLSQEFTDNITVLRIV